MTRKHVFLPLVAAMVLGSLGIQATAQAQNAFPSAGLRVKIDGETIDNAPKVYINADQCDATPSLMEFDITYMSIPAGPTPSFLEMWAGQGTDCSNPDNRKSTGGNGSTGGMRSLCWLVTRLETQIVANKTVSIKNVKTSQIFDASRDGKPPCDSATGTSYGVYFLAMTTQTMENTGTAPMATASISGTFTLYTQRPSPPTGISGRSGETEISVSWKPIAAATKTTYRAYFDVGSGGSTDADGGVAACGSGKLVAGKQPPAVDDATVFSDSSSGSSASLGSLDAKGVAIGDSVAVAVSTVDVADNKGPLSEVVCVDRVQTNGFWDNCQGESDCKNGFEKCSMSPGRGRALSFTAAVLALCALWLGRRRRNV